MRIICDLTIPALQAIGVRELPHYAPLLREACDAVPLHFGSKAYGDRYREMSQDIDWFVSSLASNTAKEAEGANRIWEMAARTGNADIRNQLIQHAYDEAKHARYYVGMLHLVFPSYLAGGTLRRLEALFPRFSPGDAPELKSEFTPPESILDELIQMNIGEIRTRIHQLLLAPVILAYCPTENIEKLQTLLNKIVSDETRHVAYTAVIIDNAVANGEGNWVRKIMLKRWAEFDKITHTEQELSAFAA